MRGTSPAIRPSLAAGAAPPWLASILPSLTASVYATPRLVLLGCLRPTECRRALGGRGLRQRQPNGAVLPNPTATGSAHQPRWFWCTLGRSSRDGTEPVMAQGDGPQNKGMKQTSVERIGRSQLIWKDPVSSLSKRVVSRCPPWGPQTTDEAGRFDDESFSYARVARGAEPHDRSPSRGSAVLARESGRYGPPVAMLRRVSSGSCLPSSVDSDPQSVK